MNLKFSDARPHEVAIIFFFRQGMNPKQIAHLLHYEYPQPVRRVLRKWREFLEPTGSSAPKEEERFMNNGSTRSFTATLDVQAASWAATLSRPEPSLNAR